MGNKLENKIDMKFLALLAAVVVAQDPTPTPDPEPTPGAGKAAAGQSCDPTKPDSGCADKLRCQIKAAGIAVPNTCVPEDTCGIEVAGVKISECNATRLAAGVAAAFAIASTL